MTLREFHQAVASELGIPREQAARLVAAVHSVTCEQLAHGNDVPIQNLGTLVPNVVEAHYSRWPQMKGRHILTYLRVRLRQKRRSRHELLRMGHLAELYAETDGRRFWEILDRIEGRLPDIPHRTRPVQLPPAPPIVIPLW